MSPLSVTHNNLDGAGVERSSVTYNTLVDAYVRAGRLREAKQVGVAAMEAGQPLDVWGHSTLIKGSLQDGDLAGAHALLHQMKRAGVPCNVVCPANSFDVPEIVALKTCSGPPHFACRTAHLVDIFE